MGTQNAALAGVTLGVCVEMRGMNTNRSIASESLRVNAFVGTRLTTSMQPGWYWRPALGGIWLFICPGMAVALLASYTDIAIAGSADVVPSGWPCHILLYWGCPLGMLWEHKDGQWLISLLGEMGMSCLNWQKCLVYIRRCGMRQMKKIMSPFHIHLKRLAPGRLKSFPCSQSGLNASCRKTHNVACVEEGSFGGCTSSFPAN